VSFKGLLHREVKTSWLDPSDPSDKEEYKLEFQSMSLLLDAPLSIKQITAEAENYKLPEKVEIRYLCRSAEALLRQVSDVDSC
jgi:hypothetical protein